jgi:hypothetical protein
VDYRGVLYAGMMLTAAGPKVIEYNVRFGDPECQVVLPRLAVDLADVVHAAARGAAPEVAFTDDACVTVVLAAEGYPASPRTGDVIEGIADAEALPGVTVFHAGTTTGPDGTVLTAGGRVLDVTATGPTLADARRAYEGSRNLVARDAAVPTSRRPPREARPKVPCQRTGASPAPRDDERTGDAAERPAFFTGGTRQTAHQAGRTRRGATACSVQCFAQLVTPRLSFP